MRDSMPDDDTDIYAVADVLAKRIDADPGFRHIVFFISDEWHDPASTSRVDSGSVARAWIALRKRIGADLRVISIRVGDEPHSDFSQLVGIDAADTASIPEVGALVGERIAADSLVSAGRCLARPRCGGPPAFCSCSLCSHREPAMPSPHLLPNHVRKNRRSTRSPPSPPQTRRPPI